MCLNFRQLDKPLIGSILRAMNSEKTVYDVIVSGGGMVGMAQAISLARAGFSVALIEKGTARDQLLPQFDGRVSAISLGSSRILEEAGIWQHIAAHGEPILDIRVSDGATPFFLHYDHNEVSHEPFGHIVENRHIRAGMQKAAETCEKLSLFENAQILSIEQNEHYTRAKLPSGQILQARLLIGAEGRNSAVREMLGIEVTTWEYAQTAIVCTIEHSLPHGGLAQERFLPIGPFAVLPMQHNRSSLVWVEPEDRIAMYMELPEAEFVQEIKERVGDYLGDIKTVGGRFSYPLSLLHAKNYAAKRGVLIGDAAHGLHPIAGQGVNLGFRDVGDLTKLLSERLNLGLDIGSTDVLERYASLRRFDNVSMLAVTDILNRLFSTASLPVQTARDIGLWVVGKLPPLKRFLMRSAMGI